jgi:hypothetical protein
MIKAPTLNLRWTQVEVQIKEGAFILSIVLVVMVQLETVGN